MNLPIKFHGAVVKRTFEMRSSDIQKGICKRKTRLRDAHIYKLVFHIVMFVVSESTIRIQIDVKNNETIYLKNKYKIHEIYLNTQLNYIIYFIKVKTVLIEIYQTVLIW